MYDRLMKNMEICFSFSLYTCFILALVNCDEFIYNLHKKSKIWNKMIAFFNVLYIHTYNLLYKK